MSNYNLKPIIPSSIAAYDAKEKRRKILEAVRARRKIISQRFEKKRQLQATRDIETLAELC